MSCKVNKKINLDGVFPMGVSKAGIVEDFMAPHLFSFSSVSMIAADKTEKSVLSL
jgi:hypothetical protein